MPCSMVSQAIQNFCQSTIPPSLNQCRRFLYDNYNDDKKLRWRCFPDVRSGGSRWDWDENANHNRRSRFTGAYTMDECGEESEFGFSNASKPRVWWSDDADAEDDDDEGVGIFEASIGFDWVVKIFRAFGWMIPVVGMSLLMGKGPDAIIMALTLPLAQSAFSLAADTLWSRDDETPKLKPRSKKRPPTGAPGHTRMRKMSKEAGNYKSWFEGNNVSPEKDSRNRPNFGRWDDLDNHMRTENDT